MARPRLQRPPRARVRSSCSQLSSSSQRATSSQSPDPPVLTTSQCRQRLEGIYPQHIPSLLYDATADVNQHFGPRAMGLKIRRRPARPVPEKRSSDQRPGSPSTRTNCPKPRQNQRSRRLRCTPGGCRRCPFCAPLSPPPLRPGRVGTPTTPAVGNVHRHSWTTHPRSRATPPSNGMVTAAGAPSCTPPTSTAAPGRRDAAPPSTTALENR